MSDVMSEYREKREREFYQKNLKKKFYREFSETDVEIISELQDKMADKYIQIPPFVLKRMQERGIIPREVELFDSNDQLRNENLALLNAVPEYQFVKSILDIGMPFEFSNEGISNPYSPYRMVWAAEFGGKTFFVKTSLPPHNDIVRVIDVWSKSGEIPIHPLANQKEVFERGEDWNIYDLLEDMVDGLEESLEGSQDGNQDGNRQDGHQDGHQDGSSE